MGLESVLGKQRSTVVLMHVTSLPNGDFVGTFGDEAKTFIDSLADSGAIGWQTLPLIHPGAYNSPYSGISTKSIAPHLINIKYLLDSGLLSEQDFEKYDSITKNSDTSITNFDAVLEHKIGKLFNERQEDDAILRKAYRRFKTREDLRPAFERFENEHSGWLDDYAEFLALTELNNGAGWQEWHPEFKNITEWRKNKDEFTSISPALSETINFYKFLQFIAYKQNDSLREYEKRKGIIRIGDNPFYPGMNSATVWANPDIFLMDFIAGCPPDSFSEDGQLWGNPVFNWENPRTIEWYADNIAHLLQHTADIVRVDHARALDTFWMISREHALAKKNARDGKFGKAPGYKLTDAIVEKLLEKGIIKNSNELPIVFETLGNLDDLRPYYDSYPVTDEFGRMMIEKSPELDGGFDRNTMTYHPWLALQKLREHYNVSDMAVMQYGLTDGHQRNRVLYTGTHDNPPMKNFIEDHLNKSNSGDNSHNSDLIVWQLGEIAGANPRELDTQELVYSVIRRGMGSDAELFIVPFQDIVGSTERMNTPGKTEGQWTYRAKKSEMDGWQQTLQFFNDYSGRRTRR